MATTRTPSITVDQLVAQICDGYVAGESLWPTDSDEDRAKVVVYYLSYLVMVRKIPYSKERVQNKVISFLEKKRDEAIKKLPLSATDRVAELLSEAIE